MSCVMTVNSLATLTIGRVRSGPGDSRTRHSVSRPMLAVKHAQHRPTGRRAVSFRAAENPFRMRISSETGGSFVAGLRSSGRQVWGWPLALAVNALVSAGRCVWRPPLWGADGTGPAAPRTDTAQTTGACRPMHTRISYIDIPPEDGPMVTLKRAVVACTCVTTSYEPFVSATLLP